MKTEEEQIAWIRDEIRRTRAYGVAAHADALLAVVDDCEEWMGEEDGTADAWGGGIRADCIEKIKIIAKLLGET